MNLMLTKLFLYIKGYMSELGYRLVASKATQLQCYCIECFV
jgi:hypothetical protein